MNLNTAINLFLGEQIPSTRKSYFYVLKSMVDYLGPARPLNAVTSAALIEYIQAVRARPGVRSVATINKYVKTIRTFFNWCIKASLLQPPPPSDGLKRLRQPKAIAREKAMPDHVYEQLLDFAKWEPRLHALALFLGDTGCRIGGAAGLRWQQVDFEARSAVLMEKGEKTRPVFFGEECAAALRRWRQQATFDRGDYVFQRDGARMTADSLGQYFSRRCQAAQIGRWGPHSLRHRKGFQFSDSRTSPTISQMAMGHDDVKITMDYYYPHDWERVQQEMEKHTHRSPRTNPKIIDFNRKLSDG